MKAIVFYTLLLLVYEATAQKKDTILWVESERLTWNDFQGEPEARFAVASTAYDILLNIQQINQYTMVRVEAVFFKKKSWKKKKWISTEVLNHEQLHFDIVELYARKLRKKIAGLKIKKFEQLKNTIQQLYEENDEEMDRFQDLYDEETDGSMNGEKQREWELKIAKELKLYQQYAKVLQRVE
ncbi:MAG: DUF922 domain-containing protein [Sphingobacteriaceae bacterium]|nr:DUF922 domain-containing protein [Sphingobacteriaceae bacterium]